MYNQEDKLVANLLHTAQPVDIPLIAASQLEYCEKIYTHAAGNDLSSKDPFTSINS